MAPKARDAMWKWTRKDENKPVPPSAASGRPGAAPPAVSPSQEPVQKILTPQSVDGFHPDVTHIGKSIVIKGELSGSEDVYLDGELEGSIQLIDGNLTVGPGGRIRANLQARSILQSPIIQAPTSILWSGRTTGTSIGKSMVIISLQVWISMPNLLMPMVV